MPINVADRRVRRIVATLDLEPAASIVSDFLDQGLVISKCSISQLVDDAYLGNLAGLLVWLDKSSKLLRTVRRLSSIAERVLNHGCELVVLGSDQELPRLIEIVEKYGLPINNLPQKVLQRFSWRDPNAEEPAPSMWFFYAGTPFREIAKLLLRRRVDDQVNVSLRLTGDALEPGDEVLVRRSLADPSFNAVHLRRRCEGYSGARAYKAQAERNGGKPIPYFLKIGPRKSTLDEFNGYLIGVEPYVPFHLAPPMLKENCCLGSRDGLLLEHYVTESESLIDCAEGGRAISPIACLFSRTLNAWHRPSTSGLLADFVSRKIPDAVGPEVFQCAKALGSPKAITDLIAIFRELGAPREVPYTWIHGDLHARNILVRGNDAVIIDMEKHCRGPLLWDPACLEASFLIEGFSRDTREPRAWFSSIEQCYTDLFTFWSHEHLTDASSWFHVAVNQVRLYVHAMAADEQDYLAVLAAAFLWKAGKAPALAISADTVQRERLAREHVRYGAAYVIAQRLLERLRDNS